MNHYNRLTQMYLKAPIHEFYEGITLEIEDKKSTISLPVKEAYFHAAMAIHGSVYFKLLDDAAFFACQSVVTDFFIVTTSFNISLLRPVTAGIITAIGEVDFVSRNLFTAQSKLYDQRGKLCGTGQGQFMKSKMALNEVEGY